MKKPNLPLLVMGAFLVGALLFVLVWSRSEPSYHGKRLSTWLNLLQNAPTSADYDEAVKAVRAIGTNALPTLLERIQRGEGPGLARKLNELLDKQSRVKFRFAVRNGFTDALLGLEALGPIAKPAVPELRRLIETTESPWPAACALGKVGPEGIALLCRSLTNQNPSVQISCVEVLKSSRSYNAPPAVPSLFILLHENGDIRGSAARALGRLATQPETVIPVMVQCLGDSDASIRAWAAWAIGRFGPAASNAVLALERIVADTSQDSATHEHAAKALKKIKPPPSAAPPP